MTERGQWGSRLGFILAAAGSAVGLGNLWKFPYIAGENGGGAFVLIYLGCIALVGLPIMIAEVMLGGMTQSSPVGAFQKLSSKRSPWVGVGALGVATGFLILSYYGVVAGWSLHYVWLAISGQIGGHPDAAAGAFAELAASSGLTVGWQLVFMAMTISVVLGGVSGGVERSARVLMPTLFVFMAAMLAYGTTLDGFGRAFDFVFGFHAEELTAGGVLEALGHAFFSLSVGMGAMLTYGSYLPKGTDVVSTSIAISLIDTVVALMACLVLFPITFTYGMEPSSGPGLVFTSIPIALAQLPGGTFWAVVFFLLLTFAALTSAVSLLEVCSSYIIDQWGWSRRKAVLGMGITISLLGIPSALSFNTEFFGAGMEAAVGKNAFDVVDYLTSNWMLPAGGLGLAVFAGWRIDREARREAIEEGSRLGKISAVYQAWLGLLRWLVPAAILLIMLHALGVFSALE